jgi:hypothetical protein
MNTDGCSCAITARSSCSEDFAGRTSFRLGDFDKDPIIQKSASLTVSTRVAFPNF